MTVVLEPMRMGDSVDKAHDLILADDRRKLSDDDDQRSKALWRSVFKDVSGEILVKATVLWLQENPKGRPNVGKIKELLRKLSPPSKTTSEQPDDDEAAELHWAVAVLEDPERFQHPNYQYTLEYAAKCLKYRGFQHWHDAKAYLQPGWAASKVEYVDL